MTLFLDPVTIDVSSLTRIRSSLSRRTIAHEGIEGIYLLDRHSNTRYVLTWELLRERLAARELRIAGEDGTLAS